MLQGDFIGTSEVELCIIIEKELCEKRVFYLTKNTKIYSCTNIARRFVFVLFSNRTIPLFLIIIMIVTTKLSV